MRTPFLLLLSLFVITTSFWGGKGKIRDGVYYSAKKDFSFIIPPVSKTKVKEMRNDEETIVLIETMFPWTCSLHFFKLPESWVPHFEEDEEQALTRVSDRMLVESVRQRYPDALVWVDKNTILADSPAHFIIIDSPMNNKTLGGTLSPCRALNGACVVKKGELLLIVSVSAHDYIQPPDKETLDRIEQGYLRDIKIVVESFQHRSIEEIIKVS